MAWVGDGGPVPIVFPSYLKAYCRYFVWESAKSHKPQWAGDYNNQLGLQGQPRVQNFRNPRKTNGSKVREQRGSRFLLLVPVEWSLSLFLESISPVSPEPSGRRKVAL